MKNLFIFLIVLTPLNFVLTSTFTEIPNFKIPLEDRACLENSDCVHIATQCSCHCGEAINKKNIDKYLGKLEELCKDYQGKMCKMFCSSTIRCENKICSYIR